MRGAGILVTAIACAAQTTPCDPRLPQSASDPYSYRLRGDRCEGTYIQEVAGAPLSIVSWTESFEKYDLAAKRPLLIQWEIGGASDAVRLRSASLRRRMYYQMDAVRPTGSKSYTWPTDLLGALQIPKEELGITGTARIRVGQTDRDVYLPLRIAQDGKPAASGSYHLTLLPGVELQEVFLTLSAVKGNQTTVVKDGEPLAYGYYPAERPIEATVSPPPPAGIYRLEIGATHKGGGVSSVELWFYHAGNR